MKILKLLSLITIIAFNFSSSTDDSFQKLEVNSRTEFLKNNSKDEYKSKFSSLENKEKKAIWRNKIIQVLNQDVSDVQKKSLIVVKDLLE